MDFLAISLPLTFLLLLAGIVVSLAASPAMIKIAKHFDILDVPGRAEHKKHERAVPLAGGMVFAISTLTLFLLFYQHYSHQLYGILLATGIIFAVGLIDDIRGLNAQSKFFGQILASIVLVSTGTQIAFVNSFDPTFNIFLNLSLTFVWLVGMTNAFNLVDSADGLSLSLGGVASVLLIFASLAANQEELAFQAGAILGIILGLLSFNLSPAQLFLGDSGSQAIGFFLAGLAIHYSPEGRPQASSWFVPITLVAVPIFDVFLVFFSRLKEHKPFYLSDLRHTYHRLRLLGLSHGKSVWVMDLAALAIGTVGLFALYQDPQIANAIFAGLVVLGFIGIWVFDKKTPNHQA